MITLKFQRGKTGDFAIKIPKGNQERYSIGLGLFTKVLLAATLKETQLESFYELQGNCKIEFSQDNWFLSMSFSLSPI